MTDLGEYVICGVCMMLEPLTVMVIAMLIWRLPPDYMDMGTSYKTKLAQKSPESWAFAPFHFGKTTFFTHVVILILSAASCAAGIVFKFPENVFAWTVTAVAFLQVFGIIGNILETEHKLKKYFGK